MQYSMSAVVPEMGGYGYTLEGPIPVKCWSRLKPDLTKIEKSLKRLNEFETIRFNLSQKKNGALS